MTTHTPGPWERDDGDGYSINRIYADGKLIAEVVGDSAEADCNANLIAAAPNLLKDLMRYGSHDNSCDAANPTSEEKHECSCGLWKAQAIVRAV